MAEICNCQIIPCAFAVILTHAGGRAIHVTWWARFPAELERGMLCLLSQLKTARQCSAYCHIFQTFVGVFLGILLCKGAPDYSAEACVCGTPEGCRLQSMFGRKSVR